MPIHLTVTDPTGNTNLAAVTITTYPCDAQGHALPPDEAAVPEKWGVTWAQRGGAAASHPSVYSNRAQSSLMFDTEADAVGAARRAIYEHYTDTLQQNVRLVP